MSELRRQIEAILFVAGEPVPLQQIAEVTETSRETVGAELAALAEEYTANGRGIAVREVAGGWRMYTDPSVQAYVERFVLNVQQPRLTQAALETLSVVAYKQPVSRVQVSQIRGVDSDGVLATLQGRGLVGETGRDEGPGQAILYGTTPLFLERMGLRSLDDLPRIADMLPSPTAADDLEP